jgi:hypothetical protein
MYAIKNEDDDKLFFDRSSVIKKMKPIEIMQYLGISEKFIIHDQTTGFSSRSYYVDHHSKNLSVIPRD